MRLDPLSKAKPRELDRKMWADIDRLMYEFQAKGRGEYLFDEPIFFGTAFSSPPILSYSSITDSFKGEDVIPMRAVPPRNVRKDLDAYHLGNHSYGVNNAPILDPGFEVQGQFIPLMGDEARYIPVTSDAPIANYGIFDDDYNYVGPPGEEEWWRNWPNVIYGVWDRDGYTAQNYDGYRSPQFQNNWIQTDERRGRWSVTDAMSHEYGVGARGKYSAEYTFVDGGSSNWMIPLGWQSFYVDDLVAGKPATAHWGFFSLQTWGGHYWGTDTPPLLPGWEGTAAVWSDDDCELEVWYYDWWLTEGYEDDGRVGGRDDPTGWWAYEKMPYSYDDPTPLVDADLWNDYVDYYGNLREQSTTWPTCHMSSNEKVKIPITGGKWNDVSFYLPRGQLQWQLPVYPPGHDLNVGGPGWQQMTMRFRINNGSPGQVARLDNVYVWPDIRNVYVPMVTIGVSEWVQDEQGAYIGAKLWVKVGDP